MLCFILIGCVWGLFIPVVASRFGKLVPADSGTILYRLWHMPRFPKAKSKRLSKRLNAKWMKTAWFSFGWAVIIGALSGLSYHLFGAYDAAWMTVFFAIVGVLMAIDQQYCLLPDFFTLPLLILGFGFSVACPEMTSPMDSVVGAGYAYTISVLSVFIMRIFKSKNSEFGAGDAKMMSALGAWLGVMAINYVLVLSAVLFILWALVRGKKAGPYGPMLGVAAVVVMFLIRLK